MIKLRSPVESCWSSSVVSPQARQCSNLLTSEPVLAVLAND
ncbi:MAG: hypothetical protein WBW53_03235 [Terriglobales bacterium]